MTTHFPSQDMPRFEPSGSGGDVVFLVDDDEAVLSSLQRYLSREGLTVAAFSDPRQALAAMQHWVPRVLVTDHRMPEMTGVELGYEAQKIHPDVRIIIITGAGSESVAQESLRLGAVDYLIKPVEGQDLVRAIQAALLALAGDEYTRSMDRWLRSTLDEQTWAIRDGALSGLAVLVDALESRATGFKGHARRVANVAVRVAGALELEALEVEEVRAAALLHDIGMVGVPDGVVAKSGALDASELEVVRSHCRRGAAILGPMAHFGHVETYILEHHERLDGSGYPDGKRAGELSIGGQICGVAEAWTAMCEARPYREALSPVEALKVLEDGSGTLFAPRIIEALRDSVDVP